MSSAAHLASMGGAVVAVAPAFFAERHQHTIHETKISCTPDLALSLGLGLLSRGSGRGRLAGTREPASRGSGIICLPGSLGLLPSLLAPLDESLVQWFVALVQPAPLPATVSTTFLLVFLAAACGRKALCSPPLPPFLATFHLRYLLNLS